MDAEFSQMAVLETVTVHTRPKSRLDAWKSAFFGSRPGSECLGLDVNSNVSGAEGVEI